MIARKADDHGISKKSAAREKARRTASRSRTDRIRIGAVAGRWVEQVWAPQQIVERQVGDEWGAGESEQPRRGVQIVLLGFTSWEFAQRAAARRNLARKQRRRNRTVKEATAAANDGLPGTAGVVGKSNAGVPVVKVVIQRFGGPRFPFVSEAEVHRETVCDSGLVLNKQSVIRMGQHALRLISYRFGDGAAEIHRAVDRRLRECGCLESLEENDKRGSVDQIVQRCKRCLERVKKRERFRRPNPVEVSAESPGVTSTHMRDVVHDFKTRLLVKIRIAPVDTDGKRVSHFKVRLRTDDRKIEATPRILRAQFVHQCRTKR